jgi:hypothetical protein
MLEHQMMVIKAVSDNEELFKKEMRKAMTWLTLRERLRFHKWLIDNYLHQYPEVIGTYLSETKEEDKN